MTLDEFYNLSKDECFERIKDECRTQAKRKLCGSLICLLILIAIIIYFVRWKPEEFEFYTNTFYICLLSIFCLAAGLYAVNNLRFLRMVDSLCAPKHLLHWYEQTLNNNRKVAWLGVLGYIISLYPGIAYNIKHSDWLWTVFELTLDVAITAFWVYVYLKGYMERKSRRDEEIIDRLQDLIDR